VSASGWIVRSAIGSGIEEEIAAHKYVQEVAGQAADNYVTQEYLEELHAEMLAAAQNLEFEQAAAELVQLAESSRTAYLCAERVWFHCHRMLVSDWLVSHGHTVLHIDGEGPPKPHRLSAEARLLDGRLLYRGDRLFS